MKPLEFAAGFAVLSVIVFGGVAAGFVLLAFLDGIIGQIVDLFVLMMTGGCRNDC